MVSTGQMMGYVMAATDCRFDSFLYLMETVQ